jgi:DNA-binding MarR family transcriptional regulator
MRVPWQKNVGDEQKKLVILTLTPDGLKRADAFEGEGSEYQVLSALNQDRPQSLGHLSKAAGMSFNECVRVCKELKAKGFIAQVQRSQ